MANNFDYTDVVKTAVAPLNNLAATYAQKGQEERQHAFVSALQAAQQAREFAQADKARHETLSTELEMERIRNAAALERTKTEAGLRDTSAAKLERLQSRKEVEKTAITYKVPIEKNGELRPLEDIQSDIDKAAGGITANIRGALDKKLSELNSIKVTNPNVIEIQKSALQNVVKDSATMSQLKPEVQARLKAAQASFASGDPTDFNRLMYQLNHSWGSSWSLRGPNENNQAGTIQKAMDTQMAELGKTEHDNATNKALANYKAVEAEVANLSTQYGKHISAMSIPAQDAAVAVSGPDSTRGQSGGSNPFSTPQQSNGGLPVPGGNEPRPLAPLSGAETPSQPTDQNPNAWATQMLRNSQAQSGSTLTDQLTQKHQSELEQQAAQDQIAHAKTLAAGHAAVLDQLQTRKQSLEGQIKNTNSTFQALILSKQLDKVNAAIATSQANLDNANSVANTPIRNVFQNSMEDGQSTGTGSPLINQQPTNAPMDAALAKIGLFGMTPQKRQVLQQLGKSQGLSDMDMHRIAVSAANGDPSAYQQLQQANALADKIISTNTFQTAQQP